MGVSAATSKRVQTAATKAHDAGLISDKDFKAMTDGSLSYADLKVADKAVRDTLYGLKEGDASIATELRNAVGQQIKEQSAFTTVIEAASDLRNGR